MANQAKRKTTSKKQQRSDEEDDKRRSDWEVNNELISQEFFTSILRNKKFPTYVALAKKLKMDERTVRRHFQDNDMFEDLKIKLRALKDKALLTLAVKAVKGESHHWSRLFFEVTDEVKDKDQNITIYINGKKAS